MTRAPVTYADAAQTMLDVFGNPQTQPKGMEMATAAVAREDDAPSTDIALLVTDNPALILADEEKRDDLLTSIKSKIAAFEPDLSTAKGRAAIKSFAYDITRTKTAIDDAGKKLNEEARARINAVDAARRQIREELTGLAEQARRPLTEWEDAEDARLDECRATIQRFKDASVVTIADTAETVRTRGADIWRQEIDPDHFRELTDEAQAAKDQAVETLKAALARLEKEEAERAELERLRAEAAERERIEAEKRAAEEVERKRQEAERVEAERKAAAERAEQERIAAAEKAAAERAARESEERHQAELATERERAAEAERAAQAERDRIAAEEAARQEAERRAAAEQAQREADQEHRRKIKSAAKEALIECGCSEDVATKVVLAIIAGDIPAVSLRF